MQRLRPYQTDRTRGTSRDLPRQGRGAGRDLPRQGRGTGREPPGQGRDAGREPPGQGRGAGRARTEEDRGVAPDPENPADRRRRRAVFLAELAEARRLRARVAPRRARTARLREAMRMNTFRW
jgi:hypothetical protein